MMIRLGEYFTNIEVLKMVTSGNAELLRLSGERDPYKSARLGEISVGAWADQPYVRLQRADGSVITDRVSNGVYSETQTRTIRETPSSPTTGTTQLWQAPVAHTRPASSAVWLHAPCSSAAAAAS